MKKVVLLLSVLAASAHAEFYDGNEILRRMQSSSLVDQAIAVGYVSGVSDTGNNVTHCVPKSVTVGQVHDMVKNYLEANPANRHYTADSLIINLLKSVWPCQRRGSSL